MTSNNSHIIYRLSRIFLFLLLLCCSAQFVQSQPKNNMILADSLTKELSQQIAKVIKLNGHKGVIIKYTGLESKDLLENNILAALKSLKIGSYVEDKEIIAKYPHLSLSLTEMSVVYQNDKISNDTLQRSVKVGISGFVKTKAGALISIDEACEILTDRIDRVDVKYIESSVPDYLKAPVPERPKTFYEEVFEPFIIISTVAITIFLLFTVRS